DFRSTAGGGVLARVGDKMLVLGSRCFLTEQHIAVSDVPLPTFVAKDQEETAALTEIYVAIDGRFAGFFSLADSLKKEARESVDALRAEGVSVILLTGDRKETAEAIARQL